MKTYDFVCFFLFFACIVLETIADTQKRKFILSQKSSNSKSESICKTGLWQYSRHPNYFFEWCIWNNYCIWAFLNLLDIISINEIVKQHYFLIIVLILSVSYTMFDCLVYWTGCVPAEYYSTKKRPEYKDYQQITNMFFPWFPK